MIAPITLKEPHQIYHLENEHQVRQVWQAACKRNGMPTWLYVGKPIPVHISCARIAIDCVNCGAGVAVSRETKSALCRQCGCEYTDTYLQMPDDREWDEIVDVLCLRPEMNRNYYPFGLKAIRNKQRVMIRPETIQHLESENTKRGFPSRLTKHEQQMARQISLVYETSPIVTVDVDVSDHLIRE